MYLSFHRICLSLNLLIRCKNNIIHFIFSLFIHTLEFIKAYLMIYGLIKFFIFSTTYFDLCEILARLIFYILYCVKLLLFLISIVLLSYLSSVLMGCVVKSQFYITNSFLWGFYFFSISWKPCHIACLVSLSLDLLIKINWRPYFIFLW
jgi:hypothetical protein